MTQPEEFADDMLVSRTLAGDTQAFDVLVERHEGDIRRLLRKKGIRDAEVENDLVQDTYEAAIKNLRHLQQGDHFKGWICTIARNKAIDYHRKCRKHVFTFRPLSSVLEREPQAEPVSEELSIEDLYCQKHLVASTFAYGLKLHPKPFACLQLYIFGNTREEISRLLHIRYGSVQTYLSRARSLFRSIFLEIEHGMTEEVTP